MKEDILVHEKKNIPKKLHNYNTLTALKHPKQGKEKEAGFRNEGENENNQVNALVAEEPNMNTSIAREKEAAEIDSAFEINNSTCITAHE
jgi:hypothetical protein